MSNRYDSFEERMVTFEDKLVALQEQVTTNNKYYIFTVIRVPPTGSGIIYFILFIYYKFDLLRRFWPSVCRVFLYLRKIGSIIFNPTFCFQITAYVVRHKSVVINV